MGVCLIISLESQYRLEGRPEAFFFFFVGGGWGTCLNAHPLFSWCNSTQFQAEPLKINPEISGPI